MRLDETFRREPARAAGGVIIKSFEEGRTYSRLGKAGNRSTLFHVKQFIPVTLSRRAPEHEAKNERETDTNQHKSPVEMKTVQSINTESFLAPLPSLPPLEAGIW